MNSQLYIHDALILSKKDRKIILEGIDLLCEGKSIGSISPKLLGRSNLAALLMRKGDPDFKTTQRRMRTSTERSTDVLINKSVSNFQRYYDWYLRDMLTFPKFEIAVKDLLSEMYHGMYSLGIKGSGISLGGSVGRLDNEEKKIVKSMLNQEFHYLSGFMRDIKSGREKNAVNRFLRFATSAKSSYSTGMIINLHELTIISWKKNRITACPECDLLSKLSPFTKFNLPTTPKAGATSCLWNCKCRIYLREGTPREVKEVTERGYSRDYALGLLRRSKKSG